MRISDWSSDVCSSDLCSPDEPFIKEAISRERADLPLGKIEYADLRQGRGHLQIALLGEQPHHMVTPAVGPRLIADAAGFIDVARPAPQRSEEHTSELHSLMRISYAVFCLNKKKSQSNQVQTDQNNK